MLDKVVLVNYDYLNAGKICAKSEEDDKDCCNFEVKEHAIIDLYLFSSKNKCENEQKKAAT